MLTGETGEPEVQRAGDEVGQVWAGGGTLRESAAAGDELDECLLGGLVEVESVEAVVDSVGGDRREEVADVGGQDEAATDVVGGVAEDRATGDEAVSVGGWSQPVEPVVQQPALSGLEFGVGCFDPTGLLDLLARDQRVDVVAILGRRGQLTECTGKHQLGWGNEYGHQQSFVLDRNVVS